MTLFLAGMAAGAALAALAARLLMRRRLKLLGGFLAAAMHEINTPITAINMTVLNFINGVFGELAADHGRWMEMLRTQTSRLGGLSGELRDMIHFELKKDLVLRPEPVFLHEAVDLVLESMQKGIPAAELRLALDVPRDLPQVLADPDRLPRSIQSLLFHARKFRVSGDIALRARAEGGRGRVLVEYLGPKLAAGEAAMSLDMYYPAFRRRDQLLCAVGLGLGALRELSRLHGGELEFKSDPEGRARMTLHFPLAK